MRKRREITGAAGNPPGTAWAAEWVKEVAEAAAFTVGATYVFLVAPMDTPQEGTLVRITPTELVFFGRLNLDHPAGGRASFGRFHPGHIVVRRSRVVFAVTAGESEEV